MRYLLFIILLFALGCDPVTPKTKQNVVDFCERYNCSVVGCYLMRCDVLDDKGHNSYVTCAEDNKCCDPMGRCSK